MLSSVLQRHIFWQIVTGVSDEPAITIFRVTLVTIWRTTRRHIPEDSNLHSHLANPNLSFILRTLCPLVRTAQGAGSVPDQFLAS
jgi:hypothetical protein